MHFFGDNPLMVVRDVIQNGDIIEIEPVIVLHCMLDQLFHLSVCSIFMGLRMSFHFILSFGDGFLREIK